MKNIIFIIILNILMMYSCKVRKPAAVNLPATGQTGQTTNFTEQSTWLLGYFTRERMSGPPHSEWYQKGYDGYKWDATAVNNLTVISKDNLTIKIVLGSWCPDSRREVPCFMRILDLWQFPPEKVTFIGVDNNKLSPVGDYEKLDIQRVPTFIFYKNNIETGRIIEVPVTSLEQDMINILTQMKI